MGPRKKWNYDQHRCLCSELQKDACREILATAYPSQDFNLSFSVCSKGLTLHKERLGPCTWLLDGNLEALGRSFQIRMSLFTWALGHTR